MVLFSAPKSKEVCITPEAKVSILSMFRRGFAYLGDSAKHILGQALEAAGKFTSMVCYITAEAFIENVADTLRKDLSKNEQYLHEAPHLQDFLNIIDHNVAEIRREISISKELYAPCE